MGSTVEAAALCIELPPVTLAEVRDLDENTVIELDGSGGICAIAVEHGNEWAECPSYSYEQVGARASSGHYRRERIGVRDEVE